MSDTYNILPDGRIQIIRTAEVVTQSYSLSELDANIAKFQQLLDKWDAYAANRKAQMQGQLQDFQMMRDALIANGGEQTGGEG